LASNALVVSKTPIIPTMSPSVEDRKGRLISALWPINPDPTNVSSAVALQMLEGNPDAKLTRRFSHAAERSHIGDWVLDSLTPSKETSCTLFQLSRLIVGELPGLSEELR
jgi:hypothetical protein